MGKSEVFRLSNPFERGMAKPPIAMSTKTMSSLKKRSHFFLLPWFLEYSINIEWISTFRRGPWHFNAGTAFGK